MSNCNNLQLNESIEKFRASGVFYHKRVKTSSCVPRMYLLLDVRDNNLLRLLELVLHLHTMLRGGRWKEQQVDAARALRGFELVVGPPRWRGEGRRWCRTSEWMLINRRVPCYIVCPLSEEYPDSKW